MNIYDIAKQCNVSIATVSRVLNGSPSVSAKNREKILAVMEQRGYQPNAFARGLGLGTMKMVGILCADVADPFYAKAVSLLESGLKARGYDLLLYCTGSDLTEKKKYMEMLLSKKADAIVLIGSIFAELTDNSHIERAAHEVPVVMINGCIDVDDVYSVTSDEPDAVSQCVQLLHGAGAERILYLYNELTYSGRRKLAGYRTGLAACGLEERAELLRRVPKDLDGAQAEVAQLLLQGTAFDAVICSEDLFAVAAQKALAEAGRRLPVIGYNNSILSECATPSITSVDFMLEDMCELAMSVLNKLQEHQPAPARITVSSRLIERESFQRPERKQQP